jgi:hypothetical protein
LWLPAGFLGALAGGFRLPSAALAVGGQRVVVRVVAVLGPGAAVAAACGGGWSQPGYAHCWGWWSLSYFHLFHFLAQRNAIE